MNQHLADDIDESSTILQMVQPAILPTVTVVVPTYCERENLDELTSRVFAATESAGLSADIIIVDDNSGDGTIELCESLSRTYPVRLITRTNERGLATAVIRGLKEAGGEYVVVMDADLSHPAETVPDLISELQSGTADFVIGSRYVRGGSVDESWGVFRQLNSRIAGWLAWGLTKAKDPMAGFFAIRRDTLGDLSELNPCGYKIGLEIMVRCGCQSVKEVSIHFADRQRGESKLCLREQWLYLQHLMRLYQCRYPDLLSFILFGCVGASGLLVDVALFSGLLPLVGAPVGRALAIWAAMTWNFEWNRKVTFQAPSGSHHFSEYLRFCTACLVGAGISWGTSLGLMAASSTFGSRPIVAAVIGTAVASLANYVLCRRWVFAKRRPDPVSAERPTLVLTDSEGIRTRAAA